MLAKAPLLREGRYRDQRPFQAVFRPLTTIGLAAFALPGVALAQAASAVSGSFGFTAVEATVLITFNCTGTPTCTGRYTYTEKVDFCTNTFRQSDAYTMTGLNLAQSGAIQGTIRLAKGDYSITRLANGACVTGPTAPP